MAKRLKHFHGNQRNAEGSEWRAMYRFRLMHTLPYNVFKSVLYSRNTKQISTQSIYRMKTDCSAMPSGITAETLVWSLQSVFLLPNS